MADDVVHDSLVGLNDDVTYTVGQKRESVTKLTLVRGEPSACHHLFGENPLALSVRVNENVASASHSPSPWRPVVMVTVSLSRAVDTSSVGVTAALSPTSLTSATLSIVACP